MRRVSRHLPSPTPRPGSPGLSAGLLHVTDKETGPEGFSSLLEFTQLPPLEAGTDLRPGQVLKEARRLIENLQKSLTC